MALLALVDATQSGAAERMLGSGAVRLTDTAVLPRTPPVLSGQGLAAEDGDDETQLQQQLALQQMQQSMEQAEQQNEQAEQQFEQGMQQAQLDEQQANNP